MGRKQHRRVRRRPLPVSQDRERQLATVVADLFLKSYTAGQIAESLKITREQVYPLLIRAREAGILRFIPPKDLTLPREIAAAYPQADFKAEDLHVVDVPPLSNHLVSAAAAELVLDLMRDLARSKSPTEPIVIGLCPGRASRDFSVHLSNMFRTDENVPRKLKIVAVAAGCPANEPQYETTSFFNLFPDNIEKEYVGLMAPPVVPQSLFRELRDNIPGVKEAFAHRDEIDILVTSMGDSGDAHDLLTGFMGSLHGGRILRKMKEEDQWIGNIAYLPYSSKAPIPWSEQEYRAVTLFEINDLLLKFRGRKRSVVIIARSCSAPDCRLDRARVLRPLLTVPELRVFTKIVMDVATAIALTKPAP